MSLALLTVLWIACDFLILLGYATVLNARLFQRRKHLIAILSSGFLLLVAIAGFAYALRELVA